MIKVGTVFSGIGAIEHALNRMRLENKIVFACDNGDIDILSKEIPLDIEAIKNEFSSLENIISKVGSADEKEKLEADLKRDAALFKKQVTVLKAVDNMVSDTVKKVFETVAVMPNVKKARVKEYKQFADKLELASKKVTNRQLKCTKPN